MSKSITAPSVAWWATKTNSQVLRYFQIFLSVANLILASFAVHTSYRVDRILRLSLAVSIISSIFFLIIRFLNYLSVFAMEVILAILWFAASITLAFDSGFTSCSNWSRRVDRYHVSVNMPYAVTSGHSGSCKIAKVSLLTEVILFMLFLATTYTSYFTVLSEAKRPGSSTRSFLKAVRNTTVKALRGTVQYLENLFEEEENEPLLDLESQEDANVEDVVNETLPPLNKNSTQAEPESLKNTSINPSEC